MLIILCNKSHSHNVYLSIIYFRIYIINLFDVVIFLRILLIVTHLLFSILFVIFIFNDIVTLFKSVLTLCPAVSIVQVVQTVP